MPGRVSRVLAPASSSNPISTQKHQAASKRKQRGLDAFSIAEQTGPSQLNTRQHRLGESVDEEPQRKRRRQSETQDSEAVQNELQTKENGLELNSGSDSEGGRWRTGEVDEDNDSDIDSDEAFGESDEERYEGFKFRASAAPSQKHSDARNDKGKPHSMQDNRPKNSSKSQGENNMEYTSEEDFSEGAVDLADVLDANEDGESFGTRDGESDVSNYTDENESSSFDLSEEESDEEDSHEQRAQLRTLVNSLPKDSNAGSTSTQRKSEPPTLASALSALRESSGLDPAFEKDVKRLSKNLKAAKTASDTKMVQAPLPKRQQDRINQKAAYGTAKETLNRWVDTVKHNRRADHLVFPIPDPNTMEEQGTINFVPTRGEIPQNELEREIQQIMQQSGLNTENSKNDEDQILQAEELHAKKLPIEQVMARTAELRRARELLFREEVRAKRIKKIKSKAYRRVHRKEAQKAAQQERNLLASAGIDVSEDEREANDRRRAEARMDGRHKDSKWAKDVKRTGRTTWDEDVRDNVAEMARKNNELRKRIAGESVRANDEDDSDFSNDSEGSIGDHETNSLTAHPTERLLSSLEEADATDNLMPTESKLSTMKFMQKAENSRRRRNNEELQTLRKELNGEAIESDDSLQPEVSAGRKVFGPTIGKQQHPVQNNERLEFEEPDDSDRQVDVETHSERANKTASLDSSKPGNKRTKQASDASSKKLSTSQPCLGTKSLNTSSKKSGNEIKTLELNDRNFAQTTPPTNFTAAQGTKGWTTVHYADNNKYEEFNNGPKEDSEFPVTEDPLLPSNLELVRAAFGGDDVEASFAAEKASAVSSEDEKYVDNALPGWGSWAGQGISKKERRRIQQRTKDRFITKTEDGVKPSDRKDKGLEKVIISEKRSRKNARYLASTLPHPFESRQQYESGIRQPIGPEWTTKEIFQSSTKPRILAKPGRLIEPISNPMV